ncbi:MAG TPA: translation initiation factor IF-2 [Candidatus Ozemobacteraceae bacterium]|nr:translation initiation factor IF-2 [Candidatus Ozemobacteraceae bacterium]
MRLHEAVKQFKTERKDLVALLAKLGFQVKDNALAAVSEDMVSALEKHFSGAGKTAPAAAPAKPTAAKAEPTATKPPAKPVVREPKQEVRMITKVEPKPTQTPQPANRPATPTQPAQQTTRPAQPQQAPARPITPVGQTVPATAQQPQRPATPPQTPRPMFPTPIQIVQPAKDKKTGPKPVRPIGEEGDGGITIIKTAPVKKEGPPKKNKKMKNRGQLPQKATEESRGEALVIEGSAAVAQVAPGTPFAPQPVVKRITLPQEVTVNELAKYLQVEAVEIIKKLMTMGVFASLNQRLERDHVETLAAEYGKEITFSEDVVDLEETPDVDTDLKLRPPVVTIMGHVDHGKTSLLDRIRHAKVAEGEIGGITQHIGAYQVKSATGSITFLDTPGHEAFTAMRAQGAQITDIAILVVACDDGVQPQTVEAIHHAQAANVPIIVALNKVDKPDANAEKAKQQLMPYNLVSEDWGGKTIMVPVSAKTGVGVDQLLEMILLQAEIMELKANPNREGQGTIIEAKLDKGMGPMGTLIIRKGTIRVGDSIICGTCYGRVKALIDDTGSRIKEAGPSTPVVVLGLNEVPRVGDRLVVVESTKFARYVGVLRLKQEREERLERDNRLKLTNLFARVAEGNVKELNLIIKADVQGSSGALKDALERLSNPDIKVNVIHAGVGAITESDVMLAAASNAIIIGFHVRPTHGVDEVSQRENVEIKVFRIIYDAIDAVKLALKGMYEPEYEEEVLGRAEVRRPFRISGIGMVAGSYVLEGKVARDASVRVIRDGVEVYEGKVCSLKRFKDDVREVAAGFECGIGVSNYGDLKEKDVLELFRLKEVRRA